MGMGSAGTQPQPGPKFRWQWLSGGGRGAPNHTATQGSAPGTPHRRRLLAARSLSTGILWMTLKTLAEGHRRNSPGAAAFKSESSRGPQGRAVLAAL